jgi:hypothetical protein
MNEIQTKYIEEIQIKITEAFVKKYFNKDATYWWVNDEVGTVFFINDFWLDWEVILFCICNKFKRDNCAGLVMESTSSNTTNFK